MTASIWRLISMWVILMNTKQAYGAQTKSQGCPNQPEGILTETAYLNNQINITVTEFNDFKEAFDGEKLLFETYKAWCVTAKAEPYQSPATIFLPDYYLIYGLQVSGYRHLPGGTGDDYITESIQIQFGNGTQQWLLYEGGQAIPTKIYKDKRLTFSEPVVANSVRVYMKTNPLDSKCLKMQLYGCKVTRSPITTRASAATHTTSTTTSTTTIPTTTTTFNNTGQQTTITIRPAYLSPKFSSSKGHIVWYSIRDGLDYVGNVSWKDVNYVGKTSTDGVLSDGTGCLTNDKHDNDVTGDNVMTAKNCWIGWRKSDVPNPYLRIKLSHLGLYYGIVLRIYIDRQIQAAIIDNIRITYDNSGEEIRYIYTCPDQLNSLQSNVYDIFINLGGVHAEFISLQFDYTSEWILMRQIKIIEENITSVATVNQKDNCSLVAMRNATVKTPKRSNQLSDETIFKIRLFGSLSVLVVFSIGIAIWCWRCRKKRNESVTSDLPISSNADGYNTYEEGMVELKVPSYDTSDCNHLLVDVPDPTSANEPVYSRIVKIDKNGIEQDEAITNPQQKEHSDDSTISSSPKSELQNRNSSTSETYELMKYLKYSKPVNYRYPTKHHDAKYQNTIKLLQSADGYMSDSSDDCVYVEPDLHPHNPKTMNYINKDTPHYYKGLLDFDKTSLQYMELIKRDEQSDIQRSP